MNFHVGSFESEIAQIFCRAEPSREDESGEFGLNKLVERMYGRTGNPGRLVYNGSILIRNGLADLMIDDVSLKCKFTFDFCNCLTFAFHFTYNHLRPIEEKQIRSQN